MRFKDKLGLPLGGTQFKGNLHSHTTNSDGCLTPEQAAEAYRAQGYHFLCLSEHDRFTDYRARLNREDFLILPGLEASSNLVTASQPVRRLKTHHMHGILGTQQMERNAAKHFHHQQVLTPPEWEGSWDGAAAAQQLADFLQDHGCLVTYNHPIWSRIEPEEFINTEGVWALEIYNYNTVNESGTGGDTTYWDQMLRRGKRIFAFASDDNHNQGAFDDAFGGWIQVVAEQLEHEALISALLRGDFYSSSGPRIFAWGVKDNQVYIHCSACERINFICGGDVGAGGTVIAPTRDGLHTASFPLSGTESYVRVECVDYAGKTAWTNPLFLEPEEELE